jgi:hypothetical protein
MNLQQSGFDVAIAVGATLNSRLVSEVIAPTRWESMPQRNTSASMVPRVDR